jgi:hypothetical protein
MSRQNTPNVLAAAREAAPSNREGENYSENFYVKALPPFDIKTEEDYFPSQEVVPIRIRGRLRVLYSGGGGSNISGGGGGGPPPSSLPPIPPDDIIGKNDDENDSGEKRPRQLTLTPIEHELSRIIKHFMSVFTAAVLITFLVLLVTSLIQWLNWNAAIQIPIVRTPSDNDNFIKMLTLAGTVTDMTIGKWLGSLFDLLRTLSTILGVIVGYFVGKKER